MAHLRAGVSAHEDALGADLLAVYDQLGLPRPAINPWRVEIELHGGGISLAMCNALRIALSECVLGCAFCVDPSTIDLARNTEPYPITPQVCSQIEQLRLANPLPAWVLADKFSITMDNKSDESVCVFARDIRAASGRDCSRLWNGATPLLWVGPGRSWTAREFVVRPGRGVLHAKFKSVTHTFLRFTDQDLAPGNQDENSGFAESTLTMEPRAFVVGYTTTTAASAVAAVGMAAEAAAAVQQTLSDVLEAVSAPAENSSVGVVSEPRPDGTHRVTLAMNWTSQALHCILLEGGAQTEGIVSAKVSTDRDNSRMAAEFVLQHEGPVVAMLKRYMALAQDLERALRKSISVPKK